MTTSTYISCSTCGGFVGGKGYPRYTDDYWCRCASDSLLPSKEETREKIEDEVIAEKIVIGRFMDLEFVTVGYCGTKEESAWQKNNKDWMDKNCLNSVGEYFVDVKQNFWCDFEDIDYTGNWSDLMPVVEKIKVNYDVSIRFFDGECACYINKQSIEGFEICSYGNFEPSILNVYKTVVEFIKYYNEHGK